MLRLVFLAALYLFLLLVVVASWRQLRSTAPARERGPAVSVTILDPARSRRRAGESVEVRPGATVGRDDGNTMAVDEDTVSARHAVFRHERGRWILEDLGSTNGTYVNQQRITGRHRISEGDEVQFGRVCVRFGAARSVAEKRTS